MDDSQISGSKFCALGAESSSGNFGYEAGGALGTGGGY